MGWRGTAVLALLIVVVGTYLWREERPAKKPSLPTANLLGEPQGADANQPVPRLLDFQPADVVGVRLEENGQVREAERANATWQPPASSDAINDFLHNLTQLGALMDIPAGAAELKDYGLQPPHSVVQLRIRGRDAPLVLQIGDRNPTVTGVYVRIGDNGPVKLAGALMTWEFDKAFKTLETTSAGS